jgi:S-adenosylmethionine synthetase
MILVTGASGLLGRAVFKHFEARGEPVIGTGFTRVSPPLLQLNLTDRVAVEAFLGTHRPSVVVHCAAERRPDVSAKNEQATLELNVNTSKMLAELSRTLQFFLVYISTDYVFDGTSPPYQVDSVPHPLNFYGETKLQGEIQVSAHASQFCILRVPVLYGKTLFNGESAITTLIDAVRNKEQPAKIDDYCVRYPTCVDDIAQVIHEMLTKRAHGVTFSGTFHFSAPQKFTKYEMCRAFAQVFQLDISHLTPDSSKPTGSAGIFLIQLRPDQRIAHYL